MDELFDLLPEPEQDLVFILSACRAKEFANREKQVVEDVNQSKHLLELCPDDIHDDFARHLKTLRMVDKEFICHMYTSGFKDGFCAYIRCLKLCHDRGLDSVFELSKSLQEEEGAEEAEEEGAAETAETLDKLIAHLQYLKERIS